MNRIIRIVALASALAAAAPAIAQQQGSQARIGLGIGLPTSELAPLILLDFGGGAGITPQLYVPINLTPNIRIEPQIGILTLNDDATDSSASYWSIGTGAFWVMPLGGNVGMYVGPRLVLSFLNVEDVGGTGVVTKTEGTDVFVAAALGGEYSVTPRFSVGAEGQLGYTSIGDRDTTVGGVTVTTQGGSSWATQGVLFVRVYLF